MAKLHRLFPAIFLLLASPLSPNADDMPWVVVSKDKKGFALEPSGKPFTPWGFNYDRDALGRLIEDYWDAEWPTIEAHFAQMKKLGANVVRIHLQLGKFMDGPVRPNNHALDRLAKLLRLAERQRLYLDLTGLGCYHKQDVPAWYDKLSEKDRWDVQARFWQAVAGRCATSPAIFCYDLMNEPVVPGGKRAEGDWLGPPFAGKHFVQVITLDQEDRPRPDIAQQWLRHLVKAIREKDKRHLVTVGLVDWSLDRPGLTSGFVPAKIAGDLDFIAVHLYPKAGKLDEALETLAGFAVGKPVVIEEMFPLSCSAAELGEFIEASKKHAAGWIGFYWGKTPYELHSSETVADRLTLEWLELFEKKAASPANKMAKAKPRPKNPFVGTWHIVSASNWDEGQQHQETDAFIEFDEDGRGSFEFGDLHGFIEHYRTKKKDRLRAIQFGWQGEDDEGMPVDDIGWAMLENGELRGTICLYGGEEDVGFVAKRESKSPPLIPTRPSTNVETTFPTIARWVQGFGHIEIGDQEGFGFVVRALDYGGLVFEDGKSNTLAEAMAALEKGLAEYFEREGIE